jgi:hypothetical protein
LVLLGHNIDDSVDKVFSASMFVGISIIISITIVVTMASLFLLIFNLTFL